MARLTEAGIEPTDLTGYVTRLEEAFRVALGEDLSLAPETPQGQLIGVLAIVFAELDEVLVHVVGGLNVRQASLRQLDDYGSLVDLRRIAGERTTVTATPNLSLIHISEPTRPY